MIIHGDAGERDPKAAISPLWAHWSAVLPGSMLKHLINTPGSNIRGPGQWACLLRRRQRRTLKCSGGVPCSSLFDISGYAQKYMYKRPAARKEKLRWRKPDIPRRASSMAHPIFLPPLSLFVLTSRVFFATGKTASSRRCG